MLNLIINGCKKRELLAIIRNQFDHINSTIKKVGITKEIPCNCSTECNKVWNYDNLLKLKFKRINDITCDESGEITTVASMLDGYEAKKNIL